MRLLKLKRWAARRLCLYWLFRQLLRDLKFNKSPSYIWSIMKKSLVCHFYLEAPAKPKIKKFKQEICLERNKFLKRRH